MFYKINDQTDITKYPGNIYIPKDDNNQDYKDYLKWVSNDGVKIPANAPDICNNEIIKEQLRQADIAIIRALVEGDQARIDAYKKSQAELRKLLLPTVE